VGPQQRDHANVELPSPAYDLPFLQQWDYRLPRDLVIAQLRDHQSGKIADIACGTGILVIESSVNSTRTRSTP